MTKLKNCPFCGGVAKISYFGDYEWSVLCAKCEVETDDYRTEEEAIKQWNTRHDEWQPIETAPKDGTRILVYNKGGGLNWEFKIQEPFVKIDWYRTDKKASGFIGFGLENVRHYKHTHWKPLPQPPQESE